MKAKTLFELEEDLKKLLEDPKQETSMNGKTTLSNSIHVAEPTFRKKKSRTSLKKTTRKKKQLKNTFLNIDDIEDKIEHCLQKAEDILSINTTLEESSTQWTLNSEELEQDQAFIKYLEQLDEPIPEDELADWSHDIDLFMEGLNNPDKLETLWKQSKAKKLWDDSHRSLDQYLAQNHPVEDSVSIEDYMNRWCNVIQNSKFPNSARRLPHTVAILSKRAGQFGKEQ